MNTQTFAEISRRAWMPTEQQLPERLPGGEPGRLIVVVGALQRIAESLENIEKLLDPVEQKKAAEKQAARELERIEDARIAALVKPIHEAIDERVSRLGLAKADMQDCGFKVFDVIKSWDIRNDEQAATAMKTLKALSDGDIYRLYKFRPGTMKEARIKAVFSALGVSV